MRIVLTSHLFLPDFSAGTELIAYHLAHELRARGHDLAIVTGYPETGALPDDRRFDQYLHDGLPVHRFRHNFVPMAGQTNPYEIEYNNRLFYRWFRAFLQNHRPDVVHFVHLSRLTASAIDACVNLAIPTVFTATDFWFVCPTNQLRLADNSTCQGPDAAARNCLCHLGETHQPARVRRILRHTPNLLLSGAIALARRGLVPGHVARWVRAIASRPAFLRQRLNRVDRVLAPSRLMADILTRNGLEPARLTYLPYGIPLQHIPRRTDKGQAPDLRVAFVGSLAEHKGPQILIQAVRSLPSSVPLTLTLHGRLTDFPDFVTHLRQLIADDPRITLAGAFDHTRIGEILARTDLLVCPSLWYENTPLVIYEAHAAGIPVLATDLPGMAETIRPGVDGLFFEPGNTAQLAAHLRTLAQDRPALRRLAAQTPTPKSTQTYAAEAAEIYQALTALRPVTQPSTAAAPPLTTDH